MRRIITLFLIILAYLPLQSLGQKAAPAAHGIFIDLGKDIPKRLSYQISRRLVRGGEWQELKTLHFDQDSAVFYANLTRASAHYNVFKMPEGNIRSNIWKMVAQAANIDSILYYGYTPAYREATQTAYYDETAQPNVDYEYKVSTFLEKTTRALTEVNVKGRFPAAQKTDFLLKTIHIEPFNDKMVLRYYSDTKREPAGIVLLRSTYMQTDFEPVTGLTGSVQEKDSLIYLAVDSNIRDKSVYQYVAIPFDELGNEGLPSDTVRFANAAYNNPASVQSFKTKSLEKESAIQLSWKLDKTPNVSAVNIYRSETYENKKYDLIGTASPADSVFLDKKVHPVKNYFYVLEPVTQFGRSFPSARVVGMLKANKKAMAVSGLSGEIINGKVRLSWKRPEFYTRGYYVYRAGDTDSLKQVTQLIVTDSLNVDFDDEIPKGNAVKVFTYAIKTVNTSYDISPFSERINVVNPIQVVLSTLVNVKVRSVDGKVLVFWNNRADQNYLGFQVYRRKAGQDAAYEKLNPAELNSNINYFEDATAASGQNYEYAIQATGTNAQLSAMSLPVSLHLEEKTLLPVYNLSLRSDGKSSILISWNETNQEEVSNYKIYRLNGEQKELIGTVKKGENTFEDAKANTSELNVYAVSCISKSIESQLSAPVSMRLN